MIVATDWCAGFRVVAGALLLFAGSTQAAEWANPQLLLTPEQVNENVTKADWVVVDCRPLEQYLAGHIPGAISFGQKCDQALRDSTNRAYRDIGVYERLLGKVGIGNDTHVVFYHGDQWTLLDSSVAFWILEYLGHDKAYILNGGVDAWRKAGLRLDKKPVRKPAETFTANVDPSRYATSAEVVKVAKDGGAQLIDSRTATEYDGSEIHSLRGGHIPNTTINVSHEKTLAQRTNRSTGKPEPVEYLDPDAAVAAFGALDRSSRTITYCHTGTRAAMTYLQLRLLGFENAANYDESWVVYGSNVDYPVDDEQWFDFWNAQWRIESLEYRIQQLEKKLAGN